MQRRSFMARAIAGATAGAAVVAAPAVRAQAQIRWRLASSFPKSLDTIYGASEVFAKSVSDATGGKMQVSVHPAGELVPAFGVVDAIQNGTVECSHTAPYYFFGKDETFAFDCAVPFGLNSRQQSAWMFEGNGMKLMREFYAGYNIVNFPMGNTGAQMGGWYRKEIKSLDEIKGLKMRIGGFGGKVLAAIGGVPQNIPAGEIYPALEKGTIDATEWVGPYDDQKLGFNKVAPFYYYPGWWEGGPQLSLYVNNKAFDALPADYKAIVYQRCVACAPRHAGPLRRQEPGCTQAARRCRHQAARHAAPGHGRRVQGLAATVFGPVRLESPLEEGLRGLVEVPRRPGAVVPRLRARVRQLHGGAEFRRGRRSRAAPAKKA